MKLKTKTITVIKVQDWNQLVIDTYKKPYNFQQQENCQDRCMVEITVPADEVDFKNDTLPEEVNHPDMGVSFKAWLARDPKQPLDSKDEWNRKYGIDLWWRRNFYPSLDMVINDLHEKGLLEAGEYSINIDW